MLRFIRILSRRMNTILTVLMAIIFLSASASGQKEPTIIYKIVSVSSHGLNDLIVRSEEHNPKINEHIVKFFAKETNNVNIAKTIIHKARKYNVPIGLAFALAKKESEFNVKAINRNKHNKSVDIGLFQINDKAFPQYSMEDLKDYSFNADVAMALMAELLLRFKDPYKALTAYNAGPRAAQRGKIPTTTFFYVADVMRMSHDIEARLAEYLEEISS